MGKRKHNPNEQVICKEDWEDMLQAEDIRKTDMNKVVMNFLVTECYDKAIEAFNQESGTSCINLEGIQARADIKRKIMCGEINAAMRSINEYILMRFDFSDEVNTQAQQIMIELICEGGMEIARRFGQECGRADKHQHIVDNNEDLMEVPQLMAANVVIEEILSWEGHKKESNLNHMLKKMLLVQDQVNEKEAVPKLNLSTGTLDDPVEESPSFRARFS